MSSAFGKKGDRLLAPERNAIILFAKGNKRAAAVVLGWRIRDKPYLDYEIFMERELDRLRAKTRWIAEARRRKEDMRDEKPLRVDEREAQPPTPPEEERLDERIEEVPPTPRKEPAREEDPEDSRAA